MKKYGNRTNANFFVNYIVPTLCFIGGCIIVGRGLVFYTNHFYPVTSVLLIIGGIAVIVCCVFLFFLTIKEKKEQSPLRKKGEKDEN